MTSYYYNLKIDLKILFRFKDRDDKINQLFKLFLIINKTKIYLLIKLNLFTEVQKYFNHLSHILNYFIKAYKA